MNFQLESYMVIFSSEYFKDSALIDYNTATIANFIELIQIQHSVLGKGIASDFYGEEEAIFIINETNNLIPQLSEFSQSCKHLLEFLRFLKGKPWASLTASIKKTNDNKYYFIYYYKPIGFLVIWDIKECKWFKFSDKRDYAIDTEPSLWKPMINKYQECSYDWCEA